MSDDVWDEDIGVNLTAPFVLIKLVIGLMKEKGKILNLKNICILCLCFQPVLYLETNCVTLAFKLDESGLLLKMSEQLPQVMFRPCNGRSKSNYLTDNICNNRSKTRLVGVRLLIHCA